MRKFYIALGTPSVELPLKAKQLDGSISKCIAAFKRYDEQGAIAKRTEAEALIEKLSTLSVAEQNKGLAEFLKKEIIYLKNVDIFEETELGKPVLYKTVEDSRTESDPELLGDYKNCLDFLLDMLLAAPPWSSALIKTFYSLHYNLNLGEDAEVKN